MAQSIQDPRLAFVVDYDDPQAGITRKYQLVYFLTDQRRWQCMVLSTKGYIYGLEQNC
jgi:hypothetical protein